MIEQITDLVKKFAGDAIINNTAIPNDKNEIIINETGSSILSGLQGLASDGNNFGGIAELLCGKSSISLDNPMIKQLISSVTSNLAQKTGISSEIASGVSSNIIPNVLSGLLGNSGNSSNNILSIVQALTNGNSNNQKGLMDTITSIGGKMLLDQNGDGKIDLNDAISAATGSKKGGIGGLLGSLFGK